MPDDQQQQQSQQQSQQAQSQQSQQQQSQQSQSQGQQQQSQQQQSQQSQQQSQQQQADWRKDIAGENADWMKTLERFASPKAMFESYQAIRAKMSSGELRDVKPYPDKGTPEEQAAWRAGQGIPDKPESYSEHLKDIKVQDADKPFIDGFLKAAHAANLTPSQAKATLSWLFGNDEAEAQAQQQADKDVANKTVDALRAEWGPEYRTNMNGISALLDTAPAGVKAKIGNARLADGTPVMSDPDTLRFLTGLYRQINPVSTVVPAGDDAAMAKSIDDELNGIKDVMRKDRPKYNRDEKMQKRYRELLDAKAKMDAKQKKAA